MSYNDHMNGKIYFLTFPTGLKCVGQTTRPLDIRMREYKSRSKTLTNLVHEAIRDCGWENVTVTLVMSGIQTQSALDIAEDAFVVLLKTMWPLGLNMKAGGKFNGACSGLVKDKIGAANRGRKQTREHRKNSGAAVKANWQDPEFREKTLAAQNKVIDEKRKENIDKMSELLDAGMTQTQVAKEMGKHRGTVGRWLKWLRENQRAGG